MVDLCFHFWKVYLVALKMFHFLCFIDYVSNIPDAGNCNSILSIQTNSTKNHQCFVAIRLFFNVAYTLPILINSPGWQWFMPITCHLIHLINWNVHFFSQNSCSNSHTTTTEEKILFLLKVYFRRNKNIGILSKIWTTDKAKSKIISVKQITDASFILENIFVSTQGKQSEKNWDKFLHLRAPTKWNSYTINASSSSTRYNISTTFVMQSRRNSWRAHFTNHRQQTKAFSCVYVQISICQIPKLLKIYESTAGSINGTLLLKTATSGYRQQSG